MENKDEAAFGFCNELGGTYNHGLTKREYFAGLAMQGLLAGAEVKVDPKDLAKQSIACADALLTQLKGG